MSEGSELALLTDAFCRMGAPLAQAQVMAAQLLKRARQVAADRGVTEESALAELLAKAVAGRRGDYAGP